jgi:phospholipid transport system substrate-binding protein
MSTNRIERRAFLGLTVTGVVGLGVHAAYAQSTASPAAPIERLNEALLAVMKAGHTTAFGRRFDILAAAVDRAFDLQTVLQNSIGPRWMTLPANEQAQLQMAFRRYTIANYVANFDSYAGETFAIEPQIQVVGNGDELVTTRIAATAGLPTTLSYVVRRTFNEWKAVDVLVNGAISRVAVQRSDFRTLLGRGGGPALIASLQQKVGDLSGGASS